MSLPVDGDEAQSKAASRMTTVQHSSSPAGGGGSDNGRDRISELPDEILGSILFLLPLKEAGRTTTLSKRGVGVFAGSPILLDDEHIVRRRVGRPPRDVFLHPERVDVIPRILSKHTGPIRRVRLAKTRFQGDGGDRQGIATNAFDGRGVEELIVNSIYPIRFFSDSPLRSVQLINFDWLPKEPPVLPPVFSKIRELSLCAVNFSAAGVHALLEQCVALESLLLSSFHRDEKGMNIAMERAYCPCILQVRSQSLRCLFLDVLGLKGVVIMDAPKLERLLGEVSFENSHCKVTLVNVPKLQIVGFLTMELPQPHLMLGMSLEPSGPIHSVKILGLCLNLCEIGQVKRMLQMLKYFPCVETLNIKIFTDPSIIRTFRYEVPCTHLLELAGRVGCLRDSVKTIVVGDLWLHTYSVGLEFAKILLQSAKKLQLMKIFHIPVDKRKQSRSYRQKLGLKSNPSIKARVVFPRDYISYREVSDVLMDASSLAIPDPMFYQRTFRSSYIRKEWNCYLQLLENHF